MAGIFITHQLASEVDDALLNNPTLTQLERAKLESDVESKVLSADSMDILRRSLQRKKKTLSSILGGTKLAFVHNEKNGYPPQANLSPLLVKRRKLLAAKQEQREYNKMVFGTETNPRQCDNESVHEQYNALRHQASILMNMVAAIVATFGMGYYCGGFFSDQYAVRMTYGVVAATIIMVVELILFIIRTYQMDNEHKKKW